MHPTQIITLLVIVYFVIPYLVELRLFLKRERNFRSFMKYLNFSALWHLIIAIVFLINNLIMQFTLEAYSLSETAFIMLGSFTWYLIIGMFFYLPILMVINISSWLALYLHRKTQNKK